MRWRVKVAITGILLLMVLGIVSSVLFAAPQHPCQGKWTYQYQIRRFVCVAEKVVDLGQITLNSKRYKLVEGSHVRPTLASLYPPKRVEGDFGADSDPRRSIYRWSDFRGGGMLNRISGPEDANRASERTDANIFSPDIVTLLPLTTRTVTTNLSGTIDAISELADVIYIANNNGTDIHKFDGTNWGTKLHDIPGSKATDAINFVLSGTEFIAFAGQTDWAYSSDGSAWTDRTEDVDFFTFWDGKLWLIDNNGALSWTSDVAAAPKADADLQRDFAIKDSDVVGMFVGPDAIGEPIIYVATKIGLFAHDFANGRFLATEVKVPRNDSHGLGAVAWNGDIYYSKGMAVDRYSPRQGLIADVGIYRDGTNSTAQDDKIVAFRNGGMFLLAITDNIIYAYNGRGWMEHSSTRTAWKSVHISDAHSAYRVWAGESINVYHQSLKVSLTDPVLDTTLTYETIGELRLPWFDAGQSDVNKLALAFKLELLGMSADETITSLFRLDNSTSGFTALGSAITADGVTTLTFPNNTPATDEGTPFRSIQFTLDFARASGTNTNSPKIRSLTFEYRKKLTPKYGFEFDIDLTQPYGGRDPRKMFVDLITAVQSNTLVEFNYESETGGTRNAFVDVASFTGEESTGLQPEGVFRVLVVEP